MMNTFRAYLRIMLLAIIAGTVGASTTLVYAQRSDEILVQAGKFVVDMSNQLSGVNCGRILSAGVIRVSAR